MARSRAIIGSHINRAPAAAAALWCLTLTAAIVLTARALAGRFDESVRAAVPGLLTAISLVTSLAAWELFCQSRRHAAGGSGQSALPLAVGLVSLGPPAVVAWTTTVSASPLGAGAATGILVLGLTYVIVREGARLADAQVLSPSEEPVATATGDPAAELAADQHTLTGYSDEDDVLQQFTRRRGSEGTERIEAIVRAEFAAGNRETAVHVPIHPALGGTPSVECEPLDDAPVTTSVTAAYPYGIRIDVKRTGPIDAPLTVPLGIELRSTAQIADVA